VQPHRQEKEGLPLMSVGEPLKLKSSPFPSLSQGIPCCGQKNRVAETPRLPRKKAQKKAQYPYIGHCAVKRLDYSYIKWSFLPSRQPPRSLFRG